MIRYFVLFLVFFLVSCTEEDKTLTNELVIDQGSLQGYEDENANYYLGIPYAKAPVGDLRWKPPLKHEGWKVTCYRCSKFVHATNRIWTWSIYWPLGRWIRNELVQTKTSLFWSRSYAFFR